MEKITSLMKARGMSKSDLARKLHTSRQLIGYYLGSSPTIPKVLKIAKALSCKKNPVEWRDLII